MSSIFSRLLPGEKPVAETAPISGGRMLRVCFARKKNGAYRLCGWNVRPYNLTGDAKRIYDLWRLQLEQGSINYAAMLTDADRIILTDIIKRHGC